MKVQIVGDTHCESTWKGLVDDSADEIVFLGDYVDSPFHTDAQMVGALIDIIDFKRSDPDKVRLLIGNHDAHYAFYGMPPGGGFRPGIRKEIRGIYLNSLDFMQFHHQIDGHLFTHAGITQTWWSIFTGVTGEGSGFGEIDRAGFAELREVFYNSPYRGGTDYAAGPLWCDKDEMKADGPLPGIHQHVGHSRTKKRRKISVDETTSVTYYNYPFDRGLTTIKI